MYSNGVAGYKKSFFSLSTFFAIIELVSIFEKTNLNILKPENISNNIISEYDLSLYEEIEVKNTNIHDDIDFYKGCNQPLLSLSFSTISKKNNSDFTDFAGCDDEFIFPNRIGNTEFCTYSVTDIF